VKRRVLVAVALACAAGLGVAAVVARHDHGASGGRGGVTVVSGVSLSRRHGGFLATNDGNEPTRIIISTAVPGDTFGIRQKAAGRDEIVFSLEFTLAPGSSRWIDYRDLKSSDGVRLPMKAVVMLAGRTRDDGGWPFEIVTSGPRGTERRTIRVRKVFEGRPLP